MGLGDTPRLEEVIDLALEGALAGVRTALPGRVEAFDKATRRATVQILIQDGDIDEQGERLTTRIKPMTDVPVMFVGSGAPRYAFPVRKGDLVLVLFASSSIAAWKERGELVDPGDDRHHHEADAIALAGLTIDAGGAGTLIEIDDNEIINLGTSPAPNSALLLEPFVSALSTMVTSIASAVSGIPTGGAAAGSAITAALAAFTAQVASFTSTKVKLV